MFNAIARGGAVAHAAGLTLKEFTAISATVGEATQRPGAEFGNASKSIFNRIRKPETMAKLKNEFGLDFSTPTGDVEKMSDILAKLAAVYPTLNSGEKAHLTNLIAGSNQSNRAAVMLETYTTALVAEAVASADSNSAMRENALILDTVDAKLKAINTSWDALFVSLGHAGLFDFLKSAISDAETLLDTINRISGSKSGAKDKSAYDKLDHFTKLTAQGTLNPLMSISPLANLIFSKKLNYDQLRKVSAMQRKAGGPGSAIADNIDQALNEKSRADSPASGILEAQRKIGTLGKLASAYKAMSGEIITKGQKQVLSDFDKSLPAYSDLPGGGGKEFIDAKKNMPLACFRG